MKKKIGFFVLSALSFLPLAFSQIAEIPQLIPPPPDVVSHMKFLETPVSLYTGTPQISIPLYTVQEGNYSLPVSMDYNARGIKVSEIASWVGLGWSLNAGGMISREVRTIPDEWSDGFLNSEPPLIPDPQTSLNGIKDVDMQKHASGHKDNEPDIFYYSFAGHTGRFIFDKAGKSIPYPIKISK